MGWSYGRRKKKVGENWQHNCKIDTKITRRKVLKVAKDQGVPKKVSVKPIFEFQTLGGVFLGVKNNSKNFGNQKKVDSLAKF